jgi:AcrR family transcriptional regulator
MPAGQRRPVKKADVTRARVLDAAAEVFRQKGYIGVPLADVASVAGLQAGSLYYHFPSREALGEEVLRVGQERTRQFVRQRVDQLPEGSSAFDRLRAAIIAHGVAVLELGDYTPATIRILPQVPEDIRRRHLIREQKYAADWTRLLSGAHESGDIRKDVDLTVVRPLMLGALNSAAEWYHPGGGLSGEALAAEFAEVLLGGLVASARPAQRWRSRAGLVPLGADASPVSSVELDGPVAPGQPRRAATRSRILDAAALVFHEHGYAGSRLTDIARAAEMQAGSLYYHFESREDLVISLMRDAWERTNDFVRRCVDQLPAGASELDRLTVAIAAQLVSALEKGTRTAAVIEMMAQVPENVRRQSLVDQRAYLAYWREILQRAAGNGEIRSDLDLSATLMLILGGLNWTAEWFDPKAGLKPPEIAAQWATIVIDGLALVRRNTGHRSATR